MAKMHSTMLIDSGYLHDRSTNQNFFSLKYGLTEILSEIQNGLNNVTLYAETATEPN